MNEMSITRAQFREYYPTLVPYIDIFYKEFKSDQQFLEEYLVSKLWRLNNLYTIINKDGDRVPFVMNKSQHKVYAAMLEHVRLIILKSRQQGISTFWLIDFFDDALFIPDLNIGLMAQGADEAATLLERVKFSWDNLDQTIKDYLAIKKVKDNAKAFSFSNNSTLFIRTSFRSATLQRMHISELGKIANKHPEKAKETNTGTLQAIKGGNPIAIESTAEGDNMFKSKWDKAVEHTGPLAPKDFKPVFLSWLEDPDCWCDVPQHINKEAEEYFAKIELELGQRIVKQQRWFWVMQKRELDDSDEDTDMYQEYPSTPEEAFSAVRDGTFYAKDFRKKIIEKNQIVPNLLDTNLEVDVVMDLGMDDEMCLGFWQDHANQDRLVHEYSNSGEGLEHYVNYMNDWFEKNKADPGVVTVPHDIKVKELGTGYTRLKRLRELGVRKIRVLKKAKIQDGIEAVRRLMNHWWIDETCEHVQTCFKNYSKEWDNMYQCWKNMVGTGTKNKKFTHGADMVRYRAMSKRKYRTAESRQEIKKRQKKTDVIGGLSI